MAQLYLDRSGLRLKRDGRALALYDAEGSRRTLPLTLIDQVIITANVQLEASVLSWLASNNIPVLFCLHSSPYRPALVSGQLGGNTQRRLEQYRFYQNLAWRLHWSSHLLSAKFRAQLNFLAELSEQRLQARSNLLNAISAIKHARDSLRRASSLAELRGLEGSAAARYFSALTAVFPPEVNFTGRNRRPPRDPVNACLSFSYTLAHLEAVSQLHQANLDPAIGFYHDLHYNRESLACDLVELVRPILDRFVYKLFHDRLLRRHHFETSARGCYLKSTARKTFYDAYASTRTLVRQRLRATARALARIFSDPSKYWPEEDDDVEDTLP